jgi:hypothetical protein
LITFVRVGKIRWSGAMVEIRLGDTSLERKENKSQKK